MKKTLFLLSITILSIFSVLPFLRGGFFPTQDYIYIARVYAMNNAFFSDQFPVRWVTDFRYGEPLFNFYAPLPYYLGTLIHAVGFDFLTSVKILMITAILLSGFAMYFLVREYFGDLAGVVSGLFYIYAPYHAVDVYVRGALSETWALVFFPLSFLALLKFNQKKTIGWFAVSVLVVGLLFFTHNIMSMIFTPFLITYIIFLGYTNKNWKLIFIMLGEVVLGALFSASYWLPAFFEKNLVQLSRITFDYFDFRAHFVEIRQFFKIDWGYGSSIWGGEDSMSFQVGILHWVMAVLSFFVAIFWWKSNHRSSLFIFFIGLLFGFSLFMQHNRSTPIWLLISPLSFVQFPWRFLALSIFFVSILAGVFSSFLEKQPQKIYLWFTIMLLIGGLILSSRFYFQPKEYYPKVMDKDYVSVQTLSEESKLPWDYLPIWAKKPTPQKITKPQILDGKTVQITGIKQTSTSYSFSAFATQSATLELPVFYFPGWKVEIDKKEIIIQDPNEYGLLIFKLPSGDHEIKAEFGNTPVRQWGNSLSLGVMLALVLLFLFHRRRNLI